MALPKLRPLEHVIPASALPDTPHNILIWNLAGLAGQLIELSADIKATPLTAALGLVLDAECAGDGAVWVTLEGSSFYPPDVADSGIDTDSLPVVRVPNVRTAGRAADHLVRCGGFGLIVIDLASEIEMVSEPARAESGLPAPLLTRLAGLARQQNAAVLFLTRKSPEAPSLHSLISLCAEAGWQRREGRYELVVRALKDKRGRERWTYREICNGPPGLR